MAGQPIPNISNPQETPNQSSPVDVSKIEVPAITSIVPETLKSTETEATPEKNVSDVEDTLSLDNQNAEAEAVDTSTILESTMHMEDYIKPTISGEAKAGEEMENDLINKNNAKNSW